MRNLRGSHDGDLLFFLIGETDAVFQMTMLDAGDRIPVVKHMQPLFLRHGVIIAVGAEGLTADIAAAVLKKLRGVFFDGILRLEHEGQFFILNANSAQRLISGHGILRDNSGNVITVQTDMTVQKMAVHIAVIGFRIPGMSIGGEQVVRHVKAGQDFDDPRHLHSFFDVNALHKAVSNLGMINLRDKSIGRADIIREFRAARDLLQGIDSLDTLSYFH